MVISLKNLGQEQAVIKALGAHAWPAMRSTSWKTNFPELPDDRAPRAAVMDIFSVIMLVIAGIGIAEPAADGRL